MFISDVISGIDNLYDIYTDIKGDISAKIQFIAYNWERDILKFDTGKSQDWKSEEYNPFQYTLKDHNIWGVNHEYI